MGRTPYSHVPSYVFGEIDMILGQDESIEALSEAMLENFREFPEMRELAFSRAAEQINRAKVLLAIIEMSQM